MKPVLSRFAQVGIFLAVSFFLSGPDSTLGQGSVVRKIAYTRSSSTATSELWVMNGDGSGQTRVCNCSGVKRPVLSPDGTRIAFALGANIYTVKTDGTELMSLTGNLGDNYYPTWAPDSSEIAFVSDREGSLGNGFEINVPAGTDLRTLKLYVGVWYTQGKLEVTLSDGSAPAFTDTTAQQLTALSQTLAVTRTVTL